MKNVLKLANQFYKLSKTRADKEGVELPSEAESLKKYITDSPPYNYIRLQGIQTGQLGINPKQTWGTPVGIYSYPLTTERYRKSVEFEHEFAGEAPHSYIFTARNPGKVLYLDNVDLTSEVEKLKNLFPSKVDIIDNYLLLSETQSLVKNDGSRLFFITRELSGQDPLKWAKILMLLGHDGIHDPGLGIIHQNETEQGLFFGAKTIKELDILKTFSIGKPSLESENLTIDSMPKMKFFIEMAKNTSDPKMLMKLSKLTGFLASKITPYIVANKNANETVFLEILSNKDVMDKFFEDRILRTIAGHSNVTDKVLKILFSFELDSSDEGMFLEISKNKNLSKEMIEELWALNGDDIKRNLMSCKNITKEFIVNVILTATDDVGYVMTAIKDSRLDVDDLKILHEKVKAINVKRFIAYIIDKRESGIKD